MFINAITSINALSDQACYSCLFFLGEFTILSLLPRVWMGAVSVESKFKLTRIETIVTSQLIITRPFSASINLKLETKHTTSGTTQLVLLLSQKIQNTVFYVNCFMLHVSWNRYYVTKRFCQTCYMILSIIDSSCLLWKL